MGTMSRPFAALSFNLFLTALRQIPAQRLYGLATGPLNSAALLAPSVGFFVSTRQCIVFWLLRTLSLVAFYSGASWFLHLPTLAGSLVLSSNSIVYKALIPSLCILLFIAHPVGRTSWLYTLYWLIPLGLSFFQPKSIILQSVASTFTTHAVGSLVYLYTHPTTIDFWHGLIARVWYERLTHAALLVILYYVVTFLVTSFKKFGFERLLCQIHSSFS